VYSEEELSKGRKVPRRCWAGGRKVAIVAILKRRPSCAESTEDEREGAAGGGGGDENCVSRGQSVDSRGGEPRRGLTWEKRRPDKGEKKKRTPVQKGWAAEVEINQKTKRRRESIRGGGGE